MADNMLKLNDDKTDVIFFHSKHSKRTIHLPSLRMGNDVIPPSSSVRNLGVLFDSYLSMENHINLISRSCYNQLHIIGRICPSLNEEVTKSLVHSLVTSCLDYCNALLNGTSCSSIKRLQRVQNTAARIITRTRRYEHITPVLRDLHWLPIHRRIDYKLILHVFRILNDQSPSYMSDLVKRYCQLGHYGPKVIFLYSFLILKKSHMEIVLLVLQ
ncbi:RNA-directed DNA polymerase from mobile element jockey, partial [Apostichopus japonicus]